MWEEQAAIREPEEGGPVSVSLGLGGGQVAGGREEGEKEGRAEGEESTGMHSHNSSGERRGKDAGTSRRWPGARGGGGEHAVPAGGKYNWGSRTGRG